MKNVLLALLAMAVLLASTAALAEPPAQLSYQGYLTDADGNPVTGTWTMSFAFFTEEDGGEPFHEETLDIETELGLFSALIGGEPGNPLIASLFAGGEVYLELSIETELGAVTLEPRQQVVSTPFSLYSSAAEQCEEAVNAVNLAGEAAESYVTVEQVPQYCVAEDELEALLLALGYEPCVCYNDESVALYLADMGYAPGEHFSGHYEDLEGKPDLTDLLTAEDILTLLASSGAVLMSDGSVALAGDLDFAGFQALNLAVHNAADPPEEPVAGQLWWDENDTLLKIYTGVEWSFIGQGTAADLDCAGCVDGNDVSFGYAASSQKGGAALQSLDVSCVDCVDETEVSFPWAKGVLPGGDAEHALSAEWSSNVVCAGCVQIAEIDPSAMNSVFVSYNDDETNLGANSVQGAIEKLAVGGAGGQFNEGNGTIVPYVEQWGLPAYGEATTYVHMMNPTTPKVVMHMYAGESSSFSSSSNLVVAYDFTPNQYSAQALGVQGETALQVQNPSIFNNGSHILIHQTMGGPGVEAGTWEINQVTAVNGTTLQLLKPLANGYVSNETAKAQVVLSASFGQIEIVNGGTLKPALPLAEDGSMGGIVYVRANKVTVKSGGSIKAIGAGFKGGTEGPPNHHGSSECGINPDVGQIADNCSGGSADSDACGAAGGGGNKVAGGDGATAGGCPSAGDGGAAKGDQGLSTLHFGSGGGGTAYAAGGTGGGIVVIGAQDFIVQDGATVSADGLPGGGDGAGGGAGGTVAVFSEFYQVEGTVQAAGGAGGQGGSWEYIEPLSLGAVDFNSYSHGGGYSPKYREFWYPHWSGSTIHVFNEAYQHLGSFESGTGNMMQLWGNHDGTYYTANWGQDVVRKWSDKGNNQLWEKGLGTTAGGICSDGENVYAMRHSGNTVWQLNPDNGQELATFGLPNIPNNLHGALLCAPGRLYYGSSDANVRIYDVATKEQIGIFNTSAAVYNMSFDGRVMYVSANNSTIYRYQIVSGNIYAPQGDGGNGGQGWVVNAEPLSGIINESYPKGVEIWVDGQELTPLVGDPNAKGPPAWDEQENKWGATGLTGWDTGPLDLTSVVPWTLGEHTISLKETGGAGGDVKMFLYVIYPFTASTAPVNDTCDQPVLLNVAAPITVSGTTEDIMGKTKATDANQGPFCGGSGGPDVVYAFTLDDWRQLTVDVQCAFSPRVYIKSANCLAGDVVGCGEEHFVTSTLEPGQYYLFVDGDGNLQKGDFILKVSGAPPGPPENDHCNSAQPMVFENGVAQASGMTLFSNDFHQAVCGGTSAPENVYAFTAPPGTASLDISVDADFPVALYLTKEACDAPPINCIPQSSFQMNWPVGNYYLFVDGLNEGNAGLYSVAVTLQ